MWVCAALLAAAPLGAQEPNPAQELHETQEHAAEQAQEHAGPVDIITPHIIDGHYIELPWILPPFHVKIDLPRWEPVHIGGMSIDLSPTRHVVFLILAAVLTTILLMMAASASRRQHRARGTPTGFAAGLEGVVLYLRNEVALPNLGHGGERYVPFVLTLFFFILFANLLGLVPGGSTATGNIAVTGTLAIITFIVIEIAGMRALGWGYLGTIFYWPHDMPLAMKLPMTVIMTPVEIIGKFTKPFALAIRLFANMTAGHIIVLALVGLIFSFGAAGGMTTFVAVAPFLMAVAIMMLEIFVAFLQAFIFTLLAAVFIGQIRTAHH